MAEVGMLGSGSWGMAGLSGLGDLVLTCTGDLSRNRTVGLRLGRGERLPDILASKNEGCEKPSDGGKGYCARHYAAWKRGRLPKARYKSCRIEGCRKPVTGRGRCAEHFARDYPGKQAAATGETPTPAPAT